MKKCSVTGCDRKFHARGWCALHYERWRRHGDPTAGDDLRFHSVEESFWYRAELGEDGCLLWTGTVNQDGYGTIRYNGTMIGAHRYAWIRVHGEIPEGLEIDHLCHTRNCVLEEHLRLVSRRENVTNLAGLRKDNTSGHRNVYQDKATGRWFIKFQVKGLRVERGRFPGYELHVAAWYARKAREELFGEFAGKG